MPAKLEFANHHPTLVLDLDRQAEAAAAALPLVLAAPGSEPGVLGHLEVVEVSIVDDPTIADIHLRFMNLPDPTDVITFEHGEILVSADTADANAAEFAQSRDREIAIYVIHGLLHLNGHEDKTQSGAKGMEQEQERILNEVWPAASAH